MKELDRPKKGQKVFHEDLGLVVITKFDKDNHWVAVKFKGEMFVFKYPENFYTPWLEWPVP